MTWLALFLVITSFGYAFGVRSYLSWRATGDTGLRLNAGPIGSLSWWGKVLFIAAMTLTVAAPTVVLAGLYQPWDHAPVQLLGALIAIAGMGIVVAAQRRMGASWRVGVDRTESTALVTHGLFARIRNPIFTGMTVFAIGLVLLVPTPVSLAALLVLVVAIQLQVRGVEEPYLLATHGGGYREYATRAGRFLPSVGRLGALTGKDTL